MINPVGDFGAVALVLLGLASSTIPVLVGFVIGVLTKTLWTIGISAVMPYLAYFAASALATSPIPAVQYLIAPIIDQSWSPSLTPRWATLLPLILFCCALTATCLLLVANWIPGHTAHQEPSGLILSCVAVALASATVVVLSWSPNSFASPRSNDAVCRETSVQFCLWPDQAYQLPAWEEAAQAYSRAGQGIDFVALRFISNGLLEKNAKDRVISLAVSDPTGQDLLNEMLSFQADELARACPGANSSMLAAALSRKISAPDSDSEGELNVLLSQCGT